MRQINITRAVGLLAVSSAFNISCTKIVPEKQPNIVFIFADQWRAQDVGYAGNLDVITPNIDRLAEESINFKYAVSNMPVSCPYRATLLTGQYSQTNGVFVNDVQLNPEANTIGKQYKKAGYSTAWIGKWHLNANGRSSYIPEDCRQGFDYFKGLECTHDYLHSAYYDNNDTTMYYWKGYDAIAQTKDAQKYIQEYSQKDKPFALFVSWGPPHNPYQEAPQEYLDLYKDKNISLRPNVPASATKKATKDLKGYYAHITALDDCIGMLQQTIRELGIEDNTIFVFTSDHGDMIYSHNEIRKQKPYDESILVPYLLKYPAAFGTKGEVVETIFSTVDIMPTMLGLSNVVIPSNVEGRDITPILLGQKPDDIGAAVIECLTPFGEWDRRKGKEYRGIRTKRYTYVRDLQGPWLLFDNQKDPYQLNNIINIAEHTTLQKKLDDQLQNMLKEKSDLFLPGSHYIEQWGYEVDANGTVPYWLEDSK